MQPAYLAVIDEGRPRTSHAMRGAELGFESLCFFLRSASSVSKPWLLITRLNWLR